jgi:hypothetical protein
MIMIPLWILAPLACAQELQQGKIDFKQSVLIDASHQLTFKDVLNLPFSPFNQKDKLSFSDNTVWIELSPTNVTKAQEDLYLRILPVLLTQMTLYKPSKTEPKEWDALNFEANELNQAIKLGVLEPDSKVYLNISSKINFRLYMSVDTQASMINLQRRIDMFLATSVTVMLLIAGLSLSQLFSNFNAVSLGALLLSSTASACWFCFMGFLPVLFDVNQNVSQEMLPVFLCAAIFIFLSCWLALSNQLLPKGRWIPWTWILVILTGVNVAYAFYDGVMAIECLEFLFKYGRWLCILILLLQAFESKNHLKLFSEKITFLILLVPLIQTPGLVFQYMGLFFIPDNFTFTQVILMRVLIPVSFFMLTFWSYNKFTQTRISSLNTKLKDANFNLERETLRLDQQRKFTAMIAHELKNPLMASQMALSVIQNRLTADDPTQQRVRSIEHSLQEIDDIIERCSEIDKYEQGYMPLTFDKTSLKDLLSAVKASQPSERIYAISRGLNADFEFRTDTHYLKIILSNLLTNALKYSASESLIEFKVEKQQKGTQDHLLFSVSNELGDDEPPDPTRVFDRYYRAETAKKQSGAGLGLWLSQSMAQALGSQINLSIDGRIVRFEFSLLV